jgi:Tfp pilus assembly protein PilW
MRIKTTSRPADAGFTLIEFMVASVASFVMMGAAFTLMNNAFRVNASVGEVMTTQQNVRVAMNTIARDITMAGTGLPNGGIVVPNGLNSDGLVRPGVGGGLSTDNDIMPIVSPGNSAGPTVAGVTTDALTIVSIDQESPTWNVANITVGGTRVDFVQDVRVGTTQLFANTLLVFSNANGAVFGMVTDVATASSQASFDDNDAMNVNQPTAANGNIISIANPDGTWPPTTATRVNVITYYINNSVPAHPKLMRSVNAQTPQVTVEDIDSLQVTFDLFDFETQVDTANQATTNSPNQIRSVNVSLAGRSPVVLGTTKDYYRFGLISKVNVRNATFRNRYTGV